MTEDISADREIIFEFYSIGAYVKVSAMDVVSLTEVSVQAPAGATEEVMKRHALKRLAYVLRKGLSQIT